MRRSSSAVSLLLVVLLLLLACGSEAGSTSRHTRGSRPTAADRIRPLPHAHKQRVSKTTFHTEQGRERDTTRSFKGEGTSHLRTPLREKEVPLSAAQHAFEPSVHAQLKEIVAGSVGEQFIDLLPTAATANAPEQVKIAVTGRFGELVFNWLTWNATASSDVTFGTSPSKYSRTVSGGSSATNAFVDPNTLHLVRYLHNVLVTDLQPLTTYYYRVGDASSNTWSDELSMRTVGDASSEEPLTLAWYGDLGLFNSRSMQNLSERVASGAVHGVVQVGDFSYNMDELQGMNGDWFLRDLQNVTAKVPFMGCPGNHEQAFNFSHYANRFGAYNFVTDPAGKPDQNWWYSFDLISGGVLTHYISLDTELYYWMYADLEATPERVRNYEAMIVAQWEWLVADLAQAYDSGKYAWIVAFGHRPLYCSNIDDIDDCTSDTEHLRLGPGGKYGFEAAFATRPLDLYFAAHEHSYERVYPTYNGTSDMACVSHPGAARGVSSDVYTDPKFPTHIIAGSAGCREYFDVFDQVFYGVFSAFRSATYGFGEMTVHNATHLHWVQYLDEGRGGTDELWIVKKPRSSEPIQTKPLLPATENRRGQRIALE